MPNGHVSYRRPKGSNGTTVRHRDDPEPWDDDAAGPDPTPVRYGILSSGDVAELERRENRQQDRRKKG